MTRIGIVMAQQRGTPARAFAALRTISQRRNIKLLRVVAAELRPGSPLRSREEVRMCHAIGPDADQLACCDVTVFSDVAPCCVVLHGELDLSTAAGLEQLLDRLRRDGHHQITLHLSGLEFLSVAGLTVFLRADQALAVLEGRLVLTRPTRMARRVLAITGWTPP